MASKLQVKIVTPEKTLLETEAEQIVVPATAGEIGFMYDHVPLLTSLTVGYIKFYNAEQLTEKYLLHSGFAQISNNELTILAEEIIDEQSLNKAELTQEITRLTQELKNAVAAEELQKAEKLDSELTSLQQIFSLI